MRRAQEARQAGAPPGTVASRLCRPAQPAASAGVRQPVRRGVAEREGEWVGMGRRVGGRACMPVLGGGWRRLLALPHTRPRPPSPSPRPPSPSPRPPSPFPAQHQDCSLLAWPCVGAGLARGAAARRAHAGGARRRRHRLSQRQGAGAGRVAAGTDRGGGGGGGAGGGGGGGGLRQQQQRVRPPPRLTHQPTYPTLRHPTPPTPPRCWWPRTSPLVGCTSAASLMWCSMTFPLTWKPTSTGGWSGVGGGEGGWVGGRVLGTGVGGWVGGWSCVGGQAVRWWVGG